MIASHFQLIRYCPRVVRWEVMFSQTHVCWEIPTLAGGRVSTLDGGYLPWMAGTYLGWGRYPICGWGNINYPGQGVPTLVVLNLDWGAYLGHQGTYLGWRVPTLDVGYLLWTEGYPMPGHGVGQVMPWAVRLLRLPAEGFSC